MLQSLLYSAQSTGSNVTSTMPGLAVITAALCKQLQHQLYLRYRALQAWDTAPPLARAQENARRKPLVCKHDGSPQSLLSGTDNDHTSCNCCFKIARETSHVSFPSVKIRAPRSAAGLQHSQDMHSQNCVPLKPAADTRAGGCSNDKPAASHRQHGTSPCSTRHIFTRLQAIIKACSVTLASQRRRRTLSFHTSQERPYTSLSPEGSCPKQARTVHAALSLQPTAPAKPLPENTNTPAPSPPNIKGCRTPQRSSGSEHGCPEGKIHHFGRT